MMINKEMIINDALMALLGNSLEQDVCQGGAA